MKSEYTLSVDLKNPGQFLACCGILELASRLDHNCLGSFERGLFIVNSEFGSAVLREIMPFKSSLIFDPDDEGRIKELKAKKKNISETEKAELKSLEQMRRIAPIAIKYKDAEIKIDWWRDTSATIPGFKTWSGAQTPQPIIDGMQRHLTTVDTSGDLWRTFPISEPKPFYYDSRISRLTAIDFGFSTDGFLTTFSPAVELFAAIALQRFRPRPITPRELYGFSAWSEPLPVSIAAAVAHGLIPELESSRYEFPLVVRTGGKYKAFGPAIIERKRHV